MLVLVVSMNPVCDSHSEPLPGVRWIFEQKNGSPVSKHWS